MSILIIVRVEAPNVRDRNSVKEKGPYNSTRRAEFDLEKCSGCCSHDHATAEKRVTWNIKTAHLGNSWEVTQKRLAHTNCSIGERLRTTKGDVAIFILFVRIAEKSYVPFSPYRRQPPRFPRVETEHSRPLRFRLHSAKGSRPLRFGPKFTRGPLLAVSARRRLQQPAAQRQVLLQNAGAQRFASTGFLWLDLVSHPDEECCSEFRSTS